MMFAALPTVDEIRLQAAIAVVCRMTDAEFADATFRAERARSAFADTPADVEEPRVCRDELKATP